MFSTLYGKGTKLAPVYADVSWVYLNVYYKVGIIAVFLAVLVVGEKPYKGKFVTLKEM